MRALVRLLREGSARGQEQAAWLLWELVYDPQAGSGGAGGNNPHIVSALSRAEGLVVALAAGLAGIGGVVGDGLLLMAVWCVASHAAGCVRSLAAYQAFVSMSHVGQYCVDAMHVICCSILYPQRTQVAAARSSLRGCCT